MCRTVSKIVRVSGPDAFLSLGRGVEAAIDLKCAPLVEKRKWHAVRSGKRTYAASAFKTPEGRWAKIYLHRFLLVTPTILDVDHIDGDGLNCRLRNLRAATRSENIRNARLGTRGSSGFKGVSKEKSRWRAEIYVGGKCLYLGSFDKPDDAHEAYKRAAQEHYGAFYNPG